MLSVRRMVTLLFSFIYKLQAKSHTLTQSMRRKTQSHDPYLIADPQVIPELCPSYPSSHHSWQSYRPKYHQRQTYSSPHMQEECA